MILSWTFVYPIAIALRKRTGMILASFVPSLLVSSAVAALFHDPSIDGPLYKTMSYLVPSLGLPWILGALVVVQCWPFGKHHHSVPSDA
jgi:hypothetical protein